MDNIFNKLINYVKSAKDMETAMTYIRSMGYIFLDTQPFLELYPNHDFLKPNHLKYQFMVRKTKGKKLDLRLIFAIKLWGNKTDKIGIYKNQEHLGNFKVLWKDREDINFRKLIKKWRFPDYMDYNQRRAWRAEHKKVVNPKSSYTGSAYYHACKPDIEFTDDPEGF